MSELTALELGFRLLTAAVAVFGPTVLFLGLVRFLEWLQDDALVARLSARGMNPEPRPAAVDFLTQIGGDGSAASGVRQRTTGTDEPDDSPGRRVGRDDRDP